MILDKTLALGFVFSILLAADEGMWLFDHFPKDQIHKAYEFAVSDDFLRHLERASVRFNNGGSGSIVSSRPAPDQSPRRRGLYPETERC